MSRKRTELSPTIEAEIRARTQRGESAEKVYDAIGRVISVATISRRQAEMRGRPQPSSPAAPLVALPAGDVPEDVPEGTPLEQLDRWIAKCEQGAAVAEKEGNLGALASLASKAAQLMALRRRSAPLPKPDPNDRPDYIELAKRGEERLLQLIRGTFKANAGVTSP